MARRTLLYLSLLITCTAGLSARPVRLTEFLQPPMQWRPVPLWFWNNAEIKETELTAQLDKMLTDDYYGGCAILPFGTDFSPSYLSEDYFRTYGRAIDIARKHGAAMSLYDEYGFPSGSMGAINGSGITTFKNNHPGMTVKRLDKFEYTAATGTTFRRAVNVSGSLMALVAMDDESKEIVSLRDKLNDSIVVWDVPGHGRWKVMSFVCVEDGDPNVDYLSPDAVRLFIEDTHELYYRHFPAAFGATVTTTFFDEPTMYRANGRMWTNDFNDKFSERFGFSPETIYPALWYDIGKKTAAARNCLFGMRATLYAEGFMKTISEWAEAHGILSTGHQDQEEIANPVSVSGDLMLDGKHMGIPGIDKIGGNRPAEHFYKVVSSSAYNWDKHLVMSETYGDMGNISMETMYRTAIEQYTKGINQLIPHAVWYDDNNVTFRPELSWRNPLYNYGLPDFNKFLSRLNYLLARPGRHVADVAMVYPITTLQAGHHLDGPKGFYAGGVDVPGTDYNEVSRLLTDQLGIDFTYIHPEVIDDRCNIIDGRLVMSNKLNTESFSVIIVPGSKVMTTSNMKKIEQAWENGVSVIFTTQLPCHTADMQSSDDEITSIVDRMLVSEKEKGHAIFVEHPNEATLRDAMDNMCLDVDFGEGGQPFNYIHKVTEDGHLYFFGNIDTAASTNRITLKDRLGDCSLLDPHTGKAVPAELSHKNGKTTLTLTLASGQSVFLVENKMIDKDDNTTTADRKYTIATKFKINKLSAGVCFAGRDTNNYYMWQINAEDPENPKLRPHRWFDGRPEIMGEISLAGKTRINTTDVLDLRIEIINDILAKTYINGILVDMRYGQFNQGLVGFRQAHSDNMKCEESASFDDISITDHEGTVLFREDFSHNNTFTGGTVKHGWLNVAGNMTDECIAWPATRITDGK